MSEVNDNDPSTNMLKTQTSKQWKWSIKFDEHLDALLDGQSIEDPDEQKLVCDALCALGLAEYKMFCEDTDTLESQDHHYTSTETMRELAKGMAVLDEALVHFEPLIRRTKTTNDRSPVRRPVTTLRASRSINQLRWRPGIGQPLDHLSWADVGEHASDRRDRVRVSWPRTCLERWRIGSHRIHRLMTKDGSSCFDLSRRAR